MCVRSKAGKCNFVLIFYIANSIVTWKGYGIPSLFKLWLPKDLQVAYHFINGGP